VDADSVELDQKTGLITFRAKKGHLIDLDKLHESIWATRLSGDTGMSLNWLDVTAVGEAALVDKRIVLRVSGADQHFVLTEGDKAAFVRLSEALARGSRVLSVTGRVDGWKGHFPPFLSKLPNKPRGIMVQSFQIAN
jgi:hypothetical protein